MTTSSETRPPLPPFTRESAIKKVRAAEDGWKRIRIGGVELRVLKPCSRCILTTIDPATGERSADREPMTTLKTYREREGEIWFGQNLVSDGPGLVEVGMEVEVLE